LRSCRPCDRAQDAVQVQVAPGSGALRAGVWVRADVLL